MDFEPKTSNSNDHKAPDFPLLKWIGLHELTLLLSFVFVIGGIWMMAMLADGVADGRTQEFDLALMMSLREKGDADNPIGPPWVEEMMRDFTSLGGTGILVLVVASTAIYYLIQGRYKGMAILVVAVVGAFVLSYFLKGLFDRPRPEFIPAGAYKYSASFPSGHALLAASTYLTLGGIVAQLLRRNRFKAYVLLLATFIVILVGFTRVYLGVHWPTDVLAGWVIGSVWALLWWQIVHWLRRRNMQKSVRMPG
jgi:undecaprenyl-diphosphatase